MKSGILDGDYLPLDIVIIIHVSNLTGIIPVYVVGHLHHGWHERICLHSEVFMVVIDGVECTLLCFRSHGRSVLYSVE